MKNNYPGSIESDRKLVSVRKAFERSPQRSVRRASAELPIPQAILPHNSESETAPTNEIYVVQILRKGHYIMRD
jgi:hypothetical protein